MTQLAERLLSCSEVARRVSGVGCRPTNPSTVSRWCKAGRLESVKIGRKVLIPEAALERFIASGTAAWRGEPAARGTEPAADDGRRDREVEEALARLGPAPTRGRRNIDRK